MESFEPHHAAPGGRDLVVVVGLATMIGSRLVVRGRVLMMPRWRDVFSLP